MGVTYKLKPEVINFILEKKKKETSLSCRSLAFLVAKEYKLKVSKSSINSLFKTSGLSMPVGRREKIKKYAAPQLEGLGAIFLKAADYLVGGSHLISEIIEKRLKSAAPNMLSKTEYLLYHSLFEAPSSIKLQPHSGLWFLINQRFINEDISTHICDLQKEKELGADIFQVIKDLFREVCMIRVTLSDGSILYLDGQLHTIWSATRIPRYFSTTVYNAKSYINKHFTDNVPFSFLMAPGYDKPTDELFSFIKGFDKKDKQIAKVTLCGAKSEELEKSETTAVKTWSFIFGLWPWQYKEYCTTKKIDEYKSFYSKELKEYFSVAEAEVTLLHPSTNKSMVLRGCVLCKGPSNKTSLTILTNMPVDKASKEELMGIYFSRWPNLEEGFRDHSHKVELFTYTGQIGHLLTNENPGLKKEYVPDISFLFDFYLKGLNSYVKYCFLPLQYEKSEFNQIKERFYDLKAKVHDQKDRITVTFCLPSSYAYLKDLEYACRRVNEREIFIGTKRLWLSIPSL